MNERARGSAAIPKSSLANRLLGGGAAVAGIAVAGEVVAQLIAASAGHHIPAHPMVGSIYNPLDGMRMLGTLNSRCVVGPHLMSAMFPTHAHTVCKTPSSFIFGADRQFALTAAAGFVPFVGLRLAEAFGSGQRSQGRVLTRPRASALKPTPLVMEIGVATGLLSKLGHASGIKRGQLVRLVGDDVSQDSLILGGKGQGKTTSALVPMLRQAMEQDCGALVLNVKGDFDRTVLALAEKTGRKVRVIGTGEGAEPVDLLAGVSPDMASTFIASLLLLTGNKANEAVFWNTCAENRSRAILGLLSRTTQYYSLPSLYRYLFVPAFRAGIDAGIADHVSLVKAALVKADDAQRIILEDELKAIDGCYQTIANFDDFHDEVKTGVNGQLMLILEKMVIPVMEKAFGSPKPDGSSGIEFEQLYDDGLVIVVNAPLQEHGLAAAAAMCLLKLRFYVTMDQRRLRRDCNRTRRVGLFVDECHQVLACATEGISDHTFLATSRDTGTFVVFASQSLSAFDAKVDRTMTLALIANLRQRIYFRTEDRWTIDDALSLLGQTEVDQESTSTTRQPMSWFGSKSTSHQMQRQSIADASLIRNLKKDEALALLSIGGESADDVITLNPEYHVEEFLA